SREAATGEEDAATAAAAPPAGAATDPPSSSVLSPDLSERADELAASCRDAKPFPHGVVRNFCREGVLEEILTELKQHSKVKFKETDLFKVYQSVDLGNLQPGSELASKMPALVKLRDVLYSAEHRAFVEKIANLKPGTLTDEVDCAANCHAKGCHLLCHDDVIGTRKVSYIVYLTDPSPAWRDEDGGRLELYEAVADEDLRDDATTTDERSAQAAAHRRVPSPLPARTVLPEFNSMAYFEVRPGSSFHSVQEVFCDRPRLSIQGWYHAREPPEGIEDATLRRLKSDGEGEGGDDDDGD
ncbi:hypothetical protein ACHAWF_006987, partial [Thalassiosira exigua]